MKKKVLIIISGQLRFFHNDNYNRIIKSLDSYDIRFVLFPWKNQDIKLIDKFKKIYKPIETFLIKEKKISNIISKIEYPDFAVKTENTFYMWDGILQSFDKLNTIGFIKGWKPDYVLKYRSDILPKKNQKFLIPKNFNNNQILLPDRYHWNGINDQIFLVNFSEISNFKKFHEYLKSHIKDKKFFCSEYIFAEFIKNLNISPIYNEFDYNLMRCNKKIIKKSIKSIIPLKDKIKIKFLKIKFIFRNFFSFYILKKKRNNLQDITI